jgi:hypothetical protein
MCPLSCGQVQSTGKLSNTLVEILKVFFGGWPALTLVFLLLFYSPLRDALDAIPDKVKRADEIGVLGISLKTTIRVEAARLGVNTLSETIPNLSPPAIEMLMRAPRYATSLVSYHPNDQNEYEEIYFPNSSVIAALSELQSKGLVEIEKEGNRHTKITGAQVNEVIESFQRLHPGTLRSSSEPEENVMWIPQKPLPPDTRIPDPLWKLTDLGKKAVEVVLKAVATELTTKPIPRDRTTSQSKP